MLTEEHRARDAARKAARERDKAEAVFEQQRATYERQRVAAYEREQAERQRAAEIERQRLAEYERQRAAAQRTHGHSSGHGSRHGRQPSLPPVQDGRQYDEFHTHDARVNMERQTLPGQQTLQPLRGTRDSMALPHTQEVRDNAQYSHRAGQGTESRSHVGAEVYSRTETRPKPHRGAIYDINGQPVRKTRPSQPVNKICINNRKYCISCRINV